MRRYMIRFAALLAFLCLMTAGQACAQADIIKGPVDLLWEGNFPETGLSGGVQTADTGFEEYVIAQLKKEKSVIDVSSFKISVEDFVAAYQDVFFTHPELFFVSGSFSYTQDGTYAVGLYPTYLYKGAERTKRTAVYNSAIEEIAGYARQADTTIGRLMLVNDYFCANYEYDESQQNFSPDILFSEKIGVCQSYTLGMCAVLNELGIANSYAISGEKAMNHVWNMVKVGGSWYHLDVTWNDPVPDALLAVYYRNFLLSDKGIANTGHYGWKAAHSADSDRYDDYFWQNLDMAAPVIDDHILYIGYGTGGKQLMLAWDIAQEKEETLFEYTGDNVFCATEKRIYYVESTLQEMDEPGMYAYSDCVYSVNHDGSKRELEYILGEPGTQILRMYLSDGSRLRMFASSYSYYDGNLIEINIYDSLKLTLKPESARVGFGGTLALTPAFKPATLDTPPLTYTSSNAQIVSVDENGLATGHLPGTAVITASYRDLLSAQCEITVQGDRVLILPAETKTIGEEAFVSADTDHVILPEGLREIETRAFASCEDLLYVNIPDSVSSIAADVFEGCGNLTLTGSESSGVGEYAAAQNIPYVVITKGESAEEGGEESID